MSLTAIIVLLVVAVIIALLSGPVKMALEGLIKISVVGGLALILFLSFMNMVCRPFNITFMWLEPAVRHLVYMVAFMGGALATFRNTHIKIDLVSKVLESNKREDLLVWVRRPLDICVVLVCGWLCIGAWELVKVEMEYGKEQFLGIHSSALVFITVLGFGFVGLSFFIRFVQSFKEKA